MSSESSVRPQKAVWATELNAKAEEPPEPTLLGAIDEPPERVDGAERHSRAQCPFRPHLLQR
eukprot:13765675-Alexandrium_andersonii.AAC.1